MKARFVFLNCVEQSLQTTSQLRALGLLVIRLWMNTTPSNVTDGTVAVHGYTSTRTLSQASTLSRHEPSVALKAVERSVSKLRIPGGTSQSYQGPSPHHPEVPVPSRAG